MKNEYLFDEDFEIYSDRLLVSLRDESGLIDALIRSALEEGSLQHSGWGAGVLEEGVVVLRESSMIEDSDFLGFKVFEGVELPDGFSIPLFMHSLDGKMSVDGKKSLKEKDNASIHDFMYSAKDKGINHAVFMTTDGSDTIISLYACYDSFFAGRVEEWPYEGKAKKERRTVIRKLGRIKCLDGLSEKDISIIMEFYVSRGALTNKEIGAIIGESETYVKNHFRLIFERIPSVSGRTSFLAWLIDNIG